MTKETEPNIDTRQISVVGLGQIGEMLLDTFGQVDDITLYGVGRERQMTVLKERYPDVSLLSRIEGEVMRNSSMIVVAVDRGGLTGVLEELRGELDAVEPQPILVLCQNGLLATADELKPFLWHGAEWVRESIFTAVNRNADGKVVYDPRKLKAAVAPISGASSYRVAELFRQAGYLVETCDHYEGMEASKLLLNTIGTTGVITGLSMEQTFADSQLFAIEVQAIRERMAVVQAAGMPLNNFWQLKIPAKLLMEVFAYTPMLVLSLGKKQLGKMIASERGRKLSAAATIINTGQFPGELSYYHEVFVDLGESLGLECAVDRAIMDIVTRYHRELGQMSIAKRANLLIDQLG